MTDALIAAREAAWPMVLRYSSPPYFECDKPKFLGGLYDKHPLIGAFHRAILAAEQRVLVRVVAEVEQYGEGLVPDLRIVTVWLANHFRALAKDQDQ